MSERIVTPARRRGLADEVADTVREAIFEGAYAPGAQLREVELSHTLQVSRGPVREALLRLEREGLVRTAWHRGAFVVELSAADIAELDSLRGALEGLAVRLVSERADESGLAAIEAAADAMDHSADPYAMVRADIAFHDAVYAAAGHERLRGAWEAIRSQVHLFLLTRVGVSDDLAHLPGEHRELAAALRAGDTDRASTLFADHRKYAFDLLTGGHTATSHPDPEFRESE
ncbi:MULTISPECIES: GntR family transcriptional regulator [Prauserella salsuginis group]|uniref:GntR family transcriptional regulator n=1 Tax=Prauserella salsuginis TaxID=387889 RepID=A0ABW6G1P2_9PSEU|nr:MULTISPECIES: GntR family transcriptional regulator [Prauserella salsuginis group]MCR3722264.1 DNA-binding transcriptional regulator, GntR family [Prauserella flava]MCR3736262.1 DNA-binding transcriptional regulator, GntR family [Prauserella salsuginis]